MTIRQIKCVRTDGYDPTPGHITHVGGDWGIVTRLDAVSHIFARSHTYFTLDRWGNSASVYVAKTSNNLYYLTTQADQSQENNLLSLPACW